VQKNKPKTIRIDKVSWKIGLTNEELTFLHPPKPLQLSGRKSPKFVFD